jgi:O-antigen/teichoic acid export membrane protein
MAVRRLSNPLKDPFTLRSNIAANIGANVVIAVVYFISVPLFVRYLGVEGYGLVGFFLFAQAILSVLDLGLNVMLTREFAVQISEGDRPSVLRDILRTSEVLYWTAGLLMGLAWIASASLLSRMVNPQGLSEEAVYRSFLLMGAIVALQLPVSLYSGALFGLQRQAVVSAVGVVFSILRNLGVVAALHFIASTTQVYFIWQLACWLLHVPILALLVRASLPAAERGPSFRPSLIAEKWRFVAGIGAITLVAMMLVHVDKFILARIISLEAFGYYALAAVVANGLHWLTQPVFRAMLPRLSQLTADENREVLSLLYHQSCQLLSVILFPLGGLWIFFPYEMMLLWQQDAAVAANTSLFVRLLMSGGILNALILLPYALQLAFAWTRLQLCAVVAAFVLAVPLTIVAAMTWGGVGAAIVGVSLNAALIFFVVPAMHRRLLKGEAFAWFRGDVLLPLAAVALVGVVCRSLFVESSAATQVLQLGIAFAAMAAAAIASSSLARRWIMKRLRPAEAGAI